MVCALIWGCFFLSLVIIININIYIYIYTSSSIMDNQGIYVVLQSSGSCPSCNGLG